MKKTVGYIFLFGGIIAPIIVIIMFFVGNSGSAELGIVIKGVIAGVIAAPWGAKLIKDAKAKEAEEKSKYFQSCNCEGCQFANLEAMERGEPWCTRPEPPDVDKDYCYSRVAATETAGKR